MSEVACMTEGSPVRRLNETTERERDDHSGPDWRRTSVPSLLLASAAFAITVSFVANGVNAQIQNVQILFASDFGPDNAVYRVRENGSKMTMAFTLGQPHGVAATDEYNVYVAEVNGDIIRHVTQDAGTSTLYSFDSELDNPEGLTVGPDGALYVSGTIDAPVAGETKHVYRIDPTTGQGAVYASVGLLECLDLDFDAAGNMYVADLATSVNGIIWKVTPAGQVSELVAGLGPVTGLAIAPDGETVYASVSWEDSIWRVDADGQALPFATMEGPWAMAFGAAGDLYVGSEDGKIIKFAPDGTPSVFATGFTGGIRGIAIQIVPRLTGDANRDGSVDDNDLSLLLANWTGVGGKGKDWGQGDFDGNGAVTDSDLSLLLANWTATVPVPEPTTLSLLAIGAMMLRHKPRP